MFCSRRSYMWNKTLKQFQNVLELFWSCFRVVSAHVEKYANPKTVSGVSANHRRPHESGSYNWNKTTQNNSKTNTKQTQNKIVLFWDCFSASYMWNKTLKQNKSRRGLSVNQSINFAQQHCCLVHRPQWSRQYYDMQLLIATHHVYESRLFIRL